MYWNRAGQLSFYFEINNINENTLFYKNIIIFIIAADLEITFQMSASVVSCLASYAHGTTETIFHMTDSLEMHFS